MMRSGKKKQTKNKTKQPNKTNILDQFRNKIFFFSSLSFHLFSGWEMLYSVILVCIAHITNEVEHIFMCLFIVTHISSKKCLLILLPILFKFLFCPFLTDL